MNVLSIGGSDPSSGAGIQKDIATSQLLDCHCLTVVTAITSQNTSAYLSTRPVGAKAIRSQLESVLDFDIDAVKIGMVYDSATIGVLYDTLRNQEIPIVADPVIRSTTGGRLLQRAALQDYRKKIVPLADVLTPNVAESEEISGMRPGEAPDIDAIACRILKMGAKSTVITGIDEGGKISDYVRTESGSHRISSKKIGTENHGGGCTFSMAVAVRMARGDGVFRAARFAGAFTKRSIAKARRIGGGLKVADQPLRGSVRGDLADAISKLATICNIRDSIPECQTNFVYADEDPKSVRDVAGVAGRIVKAGDGVIVAGGIDYGGSQHVASAVLAVNKKFPRIRSAINIRYDEKTVSALRSKKMRVLSYDRRREPGHVRAQEGSSVSWGVGSAVSGSTTEPDAVFHRGGVGKEPMILVFGRTPRDVLGKIARIAGPPARPAGRRPPDPLRGTGRAAQRGHAASQAAGRPGRKPAARNLT